MDYEFNAMFKNISVIFYEPKICEYGRHGKTIENVWEKNFVHINRALIFLYPANRQ